MNILARIFKHNPLKIGTHRLYFKGINVYFDYFENPVLRKRLKLIRGIIQSEVTNKSIKKLEIVKELNAISKLTTYTMRIKEYRFYFFYDVVFISYNSKTFYIIQSEKLKLHLITSTEKLNKKNRNKYLISESYLHANKDGSRDMRFGTNPKSYIYEYISGYFLVEGSKMGITIRVDGRNKINGQINDYINVKRGFPHSNLDFTFQQADNIILNLQRKEDIVSSNIRQIDKMTGQEFEDFMYLKLQSLGYDVELTPQSNDYGVDLIIDGPVRIAIQLKRYSSKVGNTAVQEVYTGMPYYDCSKACVITNNTYTRNAINLANKTGVILYSRKDLVKIILNELKIQ